MVGPPTHENPQEDDRGDASVRSSRSSTATGAACRCSALPPTATPAAFAKEDTRPRSHYHHHSADRSSSRSRTRRKVTWWWMLAGSVLAVTVVQQSHLARFAANKAAMSTGGGSLSDQAATALLLLGGGGASGDASSANGADAKKAAVVPSPNNRTNSSSATITPTNLPAQPPAASTSSSSYSLTASAVAGFAPPYPLPKGYPARMADHAVRRIPKLLLQKRDHPSRASAALADLWPIPVVAWPLWEHGPMTAEALHIQSNGLEESPWLVRSDDPFDVRPNVVWIGDTGFAMYRWSEWCDKFLEQIHRAQQYRRDRFLPTSWPTFIVDWTDAPTQQRCPQVEEALGRQWVRYSKRSIAGWRHYNESAGWVHEGRIVDLNGTGGEYAPTPLTVRTDTVENLRDALRLRNLTLSDALEGLERPTDVTHFWPLDPRAKGSGVMEIESQLRTRVSQLVWDFGNRTGRTVHVGVAGAAARGGRRGVSSAYIEALLNTKIVVVAQRDGWEDHYRLFEALVSGALVVTDRMLSLPVGLRNGTSIVEVGSADQLESLLEHYLIHPDERRSVAREGRRVAMARHRTWHRLEEVLFGRPLTSCPSKEGKSGSAGADRGAGDLFSSSCPYVLHANETRQ